MIETMETGITSPALPTLAEIERRTEELLAQPPTAALPTPEPRPRPNEPQHSLRSIFDEYALYGPAGEAVRTLAPHTEAQPEVILLQWLAAFGNVIGPSPHCTVGHPPGPAPPSGSPRRVGLLFLFDRLPLQFRCRRRHRRSQPRGSSGS